MKKLLTLLLAVVMLFALAIPALAEKGNDVKYMNIADSVGRGCGAYDGEYEDAIWEYWDDVYYEKIAGFDLNGIGGYNLPHSFPEILKQAKGYADSEVTNLQYWGMRSVEVYFALCGDFETMETFDQYAAEHFTRSYEARIGNMRRHSDEFAAAAASAELITLQIGSNDVFTSSQCLAGLDDFEGVDDLSLETVEIYVKSVWDGYNKFREYYPKVIEKILELQEAEKGTRDNVQIAAVGIFNPFANCPLLDEVYLPIGNILDTITGLMNAYIREVAARYPQLTYVDIESVETPITKGDKTLLEALMWDARVAAHPTIEGQNYIAQQILSALPEKPSKPDSTIRLNLLRPFEVTQVKLGALPVRFTQSKDQTKLTVPALLPIHQTLTVTGKDVNGKTLVCVYDLDYSLSKGYTASRLVSTTDLSKTVSGIKNAPLKLAQTLAGLLK